MAVDGDSVDSDDAYYYDKKGRSGMGSVRGKDGARFLTAPSLVNVSCHSIRVYIQWPLGLK